MKKYIIPILVFVSLFSCHKHDKLWDSITDIEHRLTVLEQQCKEMNTNISSMRVVVDVVQNNDYVTGVSTVLENGIEVGYKISFNTHPAVIIYHGKNGQDGKDGQDGTSGETGGNGQDGLSPVIGVKQAEDGKYYWTQKLGTAESTWILDDNGNKVIVGGSDGQSVLTPHIGSNGNWWIGETDTYVKASGKDGQNGSDGKDGQDGQNGQDGKDGLTPRIGSNGNWWIGYTDTGIKARGENGQDGQNGQDGRDGITPRLKIENDNWMLSVDNGLSWRNLGRAKGDDGESFFTNVINEDDKLILELEDGTSIELPKKQCFSFQLGRTQISDILPGNSYEINYTITGTDKANLEAIAPNGWKVSIQRTNTQSGKMVVTTSSPVVSEGKVLVLATDGNGTTLMQSITFLKGKLSVAQKDYILESGGGTVTVTVTTDMDYEVSIATEDQSWLSAQTDPLNRGTFTLTIAAHSGETFRYATVELVNDGGFILERITITQKSQTPRLIHVTTPGTLETLITTAELNQYENVKITGRLNTLDYDFLKSATDLRILDISDLDTESIPASAFSNSTLQTVLLPKNLLMIPQRAFYQSKITSIKIPETVVEIGEYAFYQCRQVRGDLIIPNSVTTIGPYAFNNCTFDGNLTLSSSLKEIKGYTFSGCSFTGTLVIPPDVEKIGSYAFSNCSKFTALRLNEELLSIGAYAFDGCSGFSGSLTIPDKVQTIGSYAFLGCTGYTGNLIIGKSVTTIGNGAFALGHEKSSSGLDKATGPLNFSKIYFKSTSSPNYNNNISYIDEGVHSFGLNNSGQGKLKYVAVPTGCKSEYSYFKDKAIVFEEVDL